MSAIDSVLTSMQSLYVPPWGKTTEQQVSAIGIYAKTLRNYEDADLFEAWDRIVASHKRKDETQTANWPGIDVWKRHLADIAGKNHPYTAPCRPPLPTRVPMPDKVEILISPGGQIALEAGCGGVFLTRCYDAREILDADYAARLTHEVAANLKIRPALDTMHHAHRTMILEGQVSEAALARQYLKDAA